MSEATQALAEGSKEEAKKDEAAKAVNTSIIRGRMPVAVVALARFGNNKDKANKEMAAQFGTTVGKIDDIKKNRNFAYVTAAYKPSAADKEAGIAWLKRHPEYDKAGADALVVELEAWPTATAEEQAEFDKARVAARGQSPTTKDGATADGGGGNRRKPRAKKGEGEKAPTVESTQATAESLMS